MKSEQSRAPSRVPSTRSRSEMINLNRDTSPIDDSASPAPTQAVSNSSSHSRESYPSASAPRSPASRSSSYTNASSSRSTTKRKEVKGIRNFLLSCSPPLGHLLSRFMDLGF